MARLSGDAIAQLKTYDDLRGALSHLVEGLYTSINNYGFLAILIEPLQLDGRSVEWEVAADATLFGEKHRESPLKKAYFRWERVRDETRQHIAGLDVEAAQFELVNEGLTYRDCFVISDAGGRVERLLLVFSEERARRVTRSVPDVSKRERPGQFVPEPRSPKLGGNNVLCPDRSASTTAGSGTPSVVSLRNKRSTTIATRSPWIASGGGHAT